MGQEKSKTGFLFLILILTGVVLSVLIYFGSNTGTLDINEIDASVTFVQNGTELLVRPQLENSKKSDSGSINLNIKVKSPGSGQILGQGNASIGYVKANNIQTANVFIPMSGEVIGLHNIEISLFEGGEFLLSRSANINIPDPSPKPIKENSDLKFIDMGVIVTKSSNDTALISLTPGIKNEGGNSDVVTLNLRLTDSENDRQVYQQGDNIGIIRDGESKISRIGITVIDNRSYDFFIEVFEGGQDSISGNAVQKLDLNETTKGKLLKFQFHQVGVPPVTAPIDGDDVDVHYERPTYEEEPGFEAIFSIVGLLAVAYILRRKK